MITEDYVPFETAKLLKEKGFNEKCKLVWILDKANDSEDTDGIYKLSAECFTVGRSFVDNDDIMSVCKYNGWNEYSKEAFLCPTLQMATKWLQEVHNLSIGIKCSIHGFFCAIVHIVKDENGRIIDVEDSVDWATTYCETSEDAVNKAIVYALIYLI